jgi:hypothetical protein
MGSKGLMIYEFTPEGPSRLSTEIKWIVNGI